MGNGRKASLKMVFYSSGPWTRTSKNDTIEEVIQFSEKED